MTSAYRGTGRRRLSALLSTVALTVPLAAAAVTAPAYASPAPVLQEMWRHLTHAKPIAGSSPMLARLANNTPVVIVGDRSGHLYARRLDNDKTVWTASTGGIPIDSTASVVGSGSTARLYVGVGSSANWRAGYYWAINAGGHTVWKRAPHAYPRGNVRAGVQSSMTVANLLQRNTLVSGSMRQMAYAIQSSGRVQAGFPWFEADSNFATPAVMDPGHTGRDQIVMGGDSTAGIAMGYRYRNGGHIRILRAAGHSGSSNESAGLYCQYNTNQVVQSSPAVGTFLRGGSTGIVAGTGSFYPGVSDTNNLIAIDRNCHLRWNVDLGALTTSSPALADVLGNGRLAVVEGTRSSARSGRVWALDGATGHRIWSRVLPGGVYGGVTTADLTGRGYQDVIAPTPRGTFILDGRTGAPVATIGENIGVQSTALVTNDPNGRIGITIAGYNAYNQGVIVHYQVSGSNGSRVNVRGAWPMFHHDARLTGNAAR